MRTLGSDDYFLRAKRIENPSSITARWFYQKIGYVYKNGVDTVDEEQLYRLEKFRWYLIKNNREEYPRESNEIKYFYDQSRFKVSFCVQRVSFFAAGQPSVQFVFCDMFP